MDERGAVTAARLIGDQVRRLLRTVGLARAIVVGTTAEGLVTIRWPESDVADDQVYARLAGFDVAADDEALVLPLAGIPVVLGRLLRTAPGRHSLSAPLDVRSNDASALVVHDASSGGVAWLRADSPLHMLRIFDRGIVRIYNQGSGAYTVNLDGGTTDGEILVRNSSGQDVVQLRASDGRVKCQYVQFGGSPVQILFGTGSPEGVVAANRGSLYLRTDGAYGTTLYQKISGTGSTGWLALDSESDQVVHRCVTQTASDTASTTSTTTFATAMTFDVTLPAGTWTVRALGLLSLRNGTSGATSDARLVIGGSNGTTRTRTAGALSAPQWVPFLCDHTVAGLSGTVTTTLQFKSNSGGTTSAENPAVVWLAVRTA
jgi:hypothetical protein